MMKIDLWTMNQSFTRKVQNVSYLLMISLKDIELLKNKLIYW